MQLVVLVIGFLFVGTPVLAAMTSTNYEIRFDAFGVGGDDTSNSASYQLRDTIGGNAIDQSSSTTYDVRSGYRQGIFDRVAAFQTFVQNRTTQTAATALTSNTVTVNSIANIAIGDMIAIVQDQGVSQKTAIGKVTGISGTDVTIDSQTLSSGALTINGTNDVVYTLDGTTLSLGSLSPSALSTGIFAWQADGDVDGGFGVYVYENHDLQTIVGSTTYTITDVVDGTVSVGAKEYGARSSDSTLTGSSFDTTDAAFTTSYQLVGSRTDNALNARDFLTIKAAAPATLQDGNYSHTLTLIYVGDY